MFKKICRHPLWSTVIGGLILAGITTGLSNKEKCSNFLFKQVPLWLFFPVAIIAFIAVINFILNIRRAKAKKLILNYEYGFYEDIWGNLFCGKCYLSKLPQKNPLKNINTQLPDLECIKCGEKYRNPDYKPPQKQYMRLSEIQQQKREIENQN